MKEVPPIRDRKKIAQIVQLLKSGPNGARNACYFVLGVNTALRIGDVLNLTLADVLDSAGQIKALITLKEEKTGKTHTVPINPAVHKALKEYLKVRSAERGPMLPNSPLLLSNKGLKPITRQRAHQIIAEAGRTVGLPDLGTHSLRKTFGYHMYQKSGRNVGMIQKMLNHSQSGTTLRYIGVEREEIDDRCNDLNLT
ncbi:MAG: tyrosine-type recombinase/integrase [Deltaproteobacteria bacterium]|jgi:integrase|nr:tyrosine-type recombinase/integrase [Deltaproteobacteria bacterium]